jgi:phosphohistidine phosphatase
MKELYLVRHAKSSWDYESVEDYDRPLKGRGIRDAYTVSASLTNTSDAPEALFSSPATRAVHTAMIFSRNLNFPFSAIQLREELYMCSEKDLLKFVQGLDDRFKRVMIFGHNPTMTNFVNRCIDQRIDNVPTTGVACFHFDIKSWADATFSAHLALFDYPKKHSKKN